MASSSTWALVGGAVVVGGGLLGAALWRHAHPGAPSPLAALSPVSSPAPTAPPAGPSAAPPAATPAAAPVAMPPKVADTAPAPPSAPNPEAAPGTPEAPKFDVVRVEPTGEAVIAGKAQPDSKVSLLASGKVVAEATTDASGQFVMTPDALKPGAYDLSLHQETAGKPAEDSKQAVAVAVPEKGKGQVVVALAEPGQPTQVLAAPAPPPAPDAKPTGPAKLDVPNQLAVRSVELENGNGFFATGGAPAGQKLHIYLNDSHIADVVADAGGQWTLRIGKGLTGGRYKVRVDAVGPADSKVTARVEVPFDVPVAMAKAEPPEPATPHASDATAPAPPSAPNPAEVAAIPAAPPDATRPDAAGPAASVPAPRQADSPAPAGPATPTPPSQAATPPPAPSPSNAVVEAVETALVIRGDNLWNISRVRLGNGMRYTQIYTANAQQIRDPNLIYPGQVFVVPKN